MLPSASTSLARSETKAESEFPTSSEFEDFIYLISHDVRNSVRALIELPQWISDDLAEAGIRVDGQVAQSIDLMNQHTGRLDRMLVDLLTFSRVGRMQDVTEVDLDGALTEVIDEIGLPSGFSLVRALEVPSVRMGERDILTLLNALLSNAVKHHDRQAGKVVVAAHKERNTIILRLSDNGPGIPIAYHERVFGAMTTLRPRDEVEGSGMGLAIARKIALRYHGSIDIISEAGRRGTTMEVRLPLL
ncbi:sensor histidine kinase [Roseobacter ponti]|uniref:histidine kinase n=1 Tax=Roseobacter ponti TaxID=1891787 RepID=A0A858SW62_9RHOB|nr:HAMP domain-containing sensor histidine kinase [Roseobacter ponti]QJF52238.1 HAMP domain-containing histidine kinase [Roseobacter ponti]